MPNKLPKAVRDAMARLNFIPPDKEVRNELTRAYYAGALFGVKVAELMIEKKLPKSRAEIRRMEKEAECK